MAKQKSSNDRKLSPVEITESTAPSPAVDRKNPERSLQLVRAALTAVSENGGRDLVVLDMTQSTALFDYFIIATGTSRRQLLAIADEVEVKLKAELNDRRMSLDGGDQSRWIVLDYGTVVVHLFDEETRQFYSLEHLWGDCPRMDVAELLK